ncbi:hypothetical protein [Fusobacterium sp.]|nr:hypothetical protein [Fusobacterium sp.]MEE1477106.1 hypothetical protein [Fusobacterium sp.]
MELFYVILGEIIFSVCIGAICAFFIKLISDEWEDKNKEDK